jgi:hypothetical protein
LDWEDVQRFVGRDHQGLVLNSLMSPVARDEIWLVFSLQNVDLGNREAYAKKDLVPGVCFICRGKSVSLDGGGGASDYRILLRDATGKTQIFSPADVNCYEHGQDITLHSLAPGDAVGFAVPMDKVFALRAGQRYTAVVALKSKTDDTIVCASHPVTFVAPPTQIIGVTRPPYGSERIWELLVSKLNKTPAALSLKSEVKRDYGHGVYLTSRLVNQNDKAFVPQSSRYTSLDRSLILVTDESGRFLPTNRSTSIDDLASPYYTRQTIPVGGTGNPCDYPLHLLFPLRAGNSYTVLIAQNAWSKSGDSIAVGRPLAFTVPDKNYATCFRSDSVAAVPCFARKPVAHPPTITERWSVLLHHAGEPFDGIDLKARVLGQVVPTGKQIQVGVSFQNAAGHPVCIRRLSGEAAYDVLIRNVASGEITELPIENRLQATLWVDTRTLGSGEIVNEMLHLDELNKIQKQGDYEVLIAMSLVGDVDAVYVAKPLRVRVGT